MSALANLVHETSTTTGTGNLTLSSVNGKQTFNTAFGTGGSDLFYYFISNQSAAEWEVGTGHLSDATTLVRDTVIASSNSDNAVDFAAGTKDVTNDVPAGKQSENDVFAGLITGLVISNNSTDATNDIDIAVGSARSDDNADSLVLASALTKRLDAAWAVGSGNGGLDTGSIANTTYHVWLIKRSDTGVVDALFSTSASSPTMPTNYDLKRRIGSIIRASAAIVAFRALEIAGGGVQFLRNVPATDLLDQTQNSTAATRTLSVPTGVQFEASISGFIFHGSASPALLITALDQADTAPEYYLSHTHANDGIHAVFQTTMRTNTSAQIRTRSTEDSSVLTMTTHGWYDWRRP